jgi:hypothetical protein
MGKFETRNSKGVRGQMTGWMGAKMKKNRLGEARG